MGVKVFDKDQSRRESCESRCSRHEYFCKAGPPELHSPAKCLQSRVQCPLDFRANLLMWCSGRWNRMQGAPFALFTALLYTAVLFRTWKNYAKPICSHNVSETFSGIRSDLPCQSMSIHLNPLPEVWSSVLQPVSVRPAAMA